ncbi:MAG: Hpt domain-containing protein [Desulfobulbaceae bacterium]|nr:Hpt domain-containing protein [Desulfobulbaceae bacterium]
MIPVSLQELKDHLHKTYQLSPEQIDRMVASIQRALTLEFDKAFNAINQQDMTSLWKASHSIKGALMNAGAAGWAEFAQKIEKDAKAGVDADYAALLNELQNGIRDIF